jgi:uncharacterized membrane protein YphA (DoxX/SURF4 family)
MKAPIVWIFRAVPSIILLQTLPYKFSGAQESKDLFAKLTTGALGNPDFEAFARIGTGIVELMAAILILIPKCNSKGALLTAATMLGALISHFAFIGFEGSHGKLAGMAAIALICATILIIKGPKRASLKP